MIEAGRALLEERRDQHNFILPGSGGEFFRARARDRLGEIEQSGVFALAEILRLEELGQADDIGALACGLRNAVERLGQIVGRLGAARHLDQGDGELVWHFFSNLVSLTLLIVLRSPNVGKTQQAASLRIDDRILQAAEKFRSEPVWEGTSFTRAVSRNKWFALQRVRCAFGHSATS